MEVFAHCDVHRSDMDGLVPFTEAHTHDLPQIKKQDIPRTPDVPHRHPWLDFCLPLKFT